MVAMAATVLLALNVVGSGLLAGLIAIALTKTVATWVHLPLPPPFFMSLSFFMWRYIALHFHSRVSFSTLSARSEARTSLYLFISLFLFYWSQGGLVGGFISSTPTLVIPLSLGIALASTDSAAALNQAMWISPVGMYAPPNFPFVAHTLW